MRKAVSTLVVLFVVLNCSKSAGTDRQSDTLLQTTDWLKKMLATHARSINKLADGSTLENHIEDIEFDPCTFKYRDVTSSQRDGRTIPVQVFTFTVPLAEVDVARLRSEIQEEQPRLILYTIADKQTIKGTVWWEIGDEWKAVLQETANQSRIVISFDSVEAAEQVSKYLIQVIKLCQNRTRP